MQAGRTNLPAGGSYGSDGRKLSDQILYSADQWTMRTAGGWTKAKREGCALKQDEVKLRMKATRRMNVTLSWFA
jgi:hypothetical protein